MEELIKTNYRDKTGREIHVGDIIQHRLGKFGKSGGAQNFKVIQFGEKHHLVPESQTDNKYGGTLLTEQLCEHSVVVKSNFLPN